MILRKLLKKHNQKLSDLQNKRSKLENKLLSLNEDNSDEREEIFNLKEEIKDITRQIIASEPATIFLVFSNFGFYVLILFLLFSSLNFVDNLVKNQEYQTKNLPITSFQDFDFFETNTKQPFQFYSRVMSSFFENETIFRKISVDENQFFPFNQGYAKYHLHKDEYFLQKLYLYLEKKQGINYNSLISKLNEEIINFIEKNELTYQKTSMYAESIDYKEKQEIENTHLVYELFDYSEITDVIDYYHVSKKDSLIQSNIFLTETDDYIFLSIGYPDEETKHIIKNNVLFKDFLNKENDEKIQLFQ